MKKIFLANLFLLLSLSVSQAQCDSTYLAQALKAGSSLADWAWSFVTVTPEQEEEIGDEFHEQMKEEFEIDETNAKQKKLNEILNKLTPYVVRKDIKYEIHLIDDDELINAFAIAGGHLYVTTGIMDWVNNDDELALIIGHEIAHVDLEHTIEHIKRNITIENWTSYFQMGEYASIIEQTQAILGTPFGQVDEYMADRGGAFLMWQAGYSPMKGKEFFNRLAELEGEAEEENKTINVLFRTHPYSSQRATCLEYYINNEMRN